MDNTAEFPFFSLSLLVFGLVFLAIYGRIKESLRAVDGEEYWLEAVEEKMAGGKKMRERRERRRRTEKQNAKEIIRECGGKEKAKRIAAACLVAGIVIGLPSFLRIFFFCQIY